MALWNWKQDNISKLVFSCINNWRRELAVASTISRLLEIYMSSVETNMESCRVH